MNYEPFEQIKQSSLVNSYGIEKQLKATDEEIMRKLIKYIKHEDVFLKILQFISTLTNRPSKDLLSHLHDTLSPVLYEAFKMEDANIFQKCLSLQHVKFHQTSIELELPASIVELASLDAHRTIDEKVCCMLACYDCILAELKFAMIEVLAENEDDCYGDVTKPPAISSSDIEQLLVEVVIRAKCKHLYSNLCMAKYLSNRHMNDIKCRHVLQCFAKAIAVLTDNDKQPSGTFQKSHSALDLKQYNALVQRLDNACIGNHFEGLAMQKLNRQIVLSHEFHENIDCETAT